MNSLTEARVAIVKMESSLINVEKEARNLLKEILAPCGKYGVSIVPHGQTEGFYPMAEIAPCEFKPISVVRYFNGKLELFVSEKDDLSIGTWYDYWAIRPDTLRVLCEMEYAIEYANGYNGEEENQA